MTIFTYIMYWKYPYVGRYTDRNILVNFLQVVIYLALVANNLHETWEKNVSQVNSYNNFATFK